MPFPVDDAAALAELELMYDEAVSKKKGEAQLQAILAKSIIELKSLVATNSEFEWPTS